MALELVYRCDCWTCRTGYGPNELIKHAVDTHGDTATLFYIDERILLWILREQQGDIVVCR